MWGLTMITTTDTYRKYSTNVNLSLGAGSRGRKGKVRVSWYIYICTHIFFLNQIFKSDLKHSSKSLFIHTTYSRAPLVTSSHKHLLTDRTQSGLSNIKRAPVTGVLKGGGLFLPKDIILNGVPFPSHPFPSRHLAHCFWFLFPFWETDL